MTRARVLRVIARLNVGGPALQVTALVDGLDPERFDQRLVVGEVGDGEADYLALRAPHVRPGRIAGLGPTPRPADDLRALRALMREVRRFRPHIVHTHTAKAGVLGRLAGMLGRVPWLVHSFHGHLLHGYFPAPVTGAVTLVERGLARRTDRLVAVGARVRDELLSAGIGTAAQYVVVPPGVALPAAPTRAAARAVLGLPADVPVIAFVARLTRVKRPDVALAVAERVRRTLPDAVLVVAGEGPLLPEVRARGAGLGGGLRLLGWRADVERVYAAADVALLTSDNEGMPVSLIEAALCGTPAVARRVGSTSEVVLHDRTGLVVEGHADALAAAVVRLLGDQGLRARMGAAARARADSTFGAQRLVTDTAELYESLLDRPPARPRLPLGQRARPRPLRAQRARPRPRGSLAR